MYNLMIGILLLAAALIAVFGASRRRWGMLASGLVLACLTIFFFWFMSFWGEFLWFQELGFSRRFWTVVIAKILSFAVGALVGLLVVSLFIWSLRKTAFTPRLIAGIMGSLIAGMTAASNWSVLLRFVYRVPGAASDPIFRLDIGFYFFILPFLDLVYRIAMFEAVIALCTAAVICFVNWQPPPEGPELSVPRGGDEQTAVRRLGLPISAFLVAFALGHVLDIFHLMYSEWGAVNGPGWTDVYIRLPGLILTAAAAIIGGAAILLPFTRRYTRLGMAVGSVAVVWVLAVLVAPGLVQWLRVEPNEISVEKPYIEHNIRFTRMGFDLHDIDERQYPVTEELTQQTIEDNRDMISEIRLWDWRALMAVYEQFQEIRLYYLFTDVDIDRYSFGDEYRQVMVSAREIDIGNLPSQSQTFVNKRFKYTHGYGITLAPVSDFTREGLPNLLVKNIPPVSEYDELVVERPEIYYGELSSSYVIANSKEEEFDYPSGDQNVYNRYDGQGGVPIRNLWRKFLYGWKYGGTRLLLSGYPTADSRIMFHRRPLDRLRTIAPFLRYEPDPYIVLHEGRLYWIVDAYTASNRFPYSEPYTSLQPINPGAPVGGGELMTRPAPHLDGANYVRNSVKAVIDAYNGEVSLYVYEPDDPLIAVWQRIFPKLFKAKEDMPQGLRNHVRYPESLLLVQGVVYGKYHMTDPAVFYNQEDLWVRATEKYYNNIQPVEPYFIMWNAPGVEKLQFTNILPFTPRNKQVLIGWIAGMCDEPHYGRLIAYKFPKEKRILGPQQVETKIDQDSYLAGQLSLWDQRGSRVIRGNILAIPIAETVIYVEPIYLQSETAAYPELRLVALMHGDDLSYAPTFAAALEGLLEGQPRRELPQGERAPAGAGVEASRRSLVEQANNAFDQYLQLQAQKRFGAASEQLQLLQDALEQLDREMPGSQQAEQEQGQED